MIYEKLHDICRANNFKWNNQMITKIASSLFKIQNSYLPESLYN